MPGLPHYKNAQVGPNLYEPVYIPLFSVSIAAPDGIAFDDLVIDNITKIDGIDTGKAFPTTKTQKYKGATRSYVGGKVPEQFQDLSLSFEVNLNEDNQMYVFNALRAWCDLVYNPMTGKMGMKKNYVGKHIIINQYNPDGQVFRKLTFFHPFPTTSIKGPNTFDYDSDDIYKVDGWVLRCDDYEEVYLH